MTPEKLQALRQELDALASEKWTPAASWFDGDDWADGIAKIAAQGPQRDNEDDAVRDAFFIAYAPANMRLLLDEVAHLTGLINTFKVIDMQQRDLAVREALAAFYADVCAEAERTIATTGMVSGAHWNAMQVVLARRGVTP